jgi:hypothetical protein
MVEALPITGDVTDVLSLIVNLISEAFKTLPPFGFTRLSEEATNAATPGCHSITVEYRVHPGGGITYTAYTQRPWAHDCPKGAL